jgi:hypothetical protein
MVSRLDDLIREHAERLDQLAGPIDLTDVTCGPRNDTVTVTLIDSEPSPTQPDGGLRWPIVAVAAALVAIAVGGVMVVIGDDDPISEVPAAQVTEESLQLSDRRVRESAALRIGFAGLPPVGARPSSPERGNLVLTISQCTTGPWFDGLTVLADGRLIWAVSGHVVEQRLTPEGVELMRSELLGSGLLDTHNDEDECEASYYGHMQVGDDEYESEFGAAIDDARIARLANPWSWLPASAWADREIKAFVASEYSFSIRNGTVDQLADRLPSAALFLRSKQWEGQTSAVYTGLTTDEVRTLAAALDAAGFVAGIDEYGYLVYDDETSMRVQMRPRLPDEVGVGPIPG